MIGWFIYNCLMFQSKSIFKETHYTLGILAWWLLLTILYIIFIL